MEKDKIKKLSIVGLLIVVVISMGLVIWIAFNKDSKEEPNNYDHDVALKSAVDGGYVTPNAKDIKIGMSLKEVNDLLEEEGQMTYELGKKQKYIYTASGNKSLEVIFNDGKVEGIAVVESE